MPVDPDHQPKPSSQDAEADRRSHVSRRWLRNGLQAGAATSRVRILLVDDQLSNLAALTATLDSPDYDLVTARSGEEALKRLLEGDYAVIVLDVMMPGMDGYEVASLIKQRDKTRHVPIIFLTATSRDLSNLYRSYAVGAVDCLTKPGDPDVIRAKVAVFAELFRKNQQLQSQAEQLHALAIAEERREGEERYRNLAEAIPQIVWTARPDGRIDYLNGFGREYFGIAGGASLGDWRLRSALHPDDAADFIGLWDRAIAAGARFSAEVRLERAGDGRHRWHLVRGAPEQGDHGLTAWFGTLTDVDEQKRAQHRAAFLAEASSRLASSALDLSTTLEHLCALAVPRLADACAVDLVGEGGRLERTRVMHADNKCAARLRDADRSWPEAPDTELLPSGSAALARLGFGSAMAAPLRALDRTLGVISLYADAGGRRFDEGDLVIAEDLAHRAAIAVNNAQLYGEAQEAIRARDQFLLVAAHELKTPLTSLQLQLQRTNRFLHQPGEVADLKERMLERTQVATRAVGRLSKLIDVVLDVSRLTAGLMALDRERFDLAVLARDQAAQLAEESAQAAAPITVEARAPVEGEWDRRALDQVLGNLLSNALKYGAGHPIEVEVSGDAERARLVVRDHGIGIAAAAQVNIFDRFARAVSARNYGGLGLGLFIAREIVQAHGGTIAVESTPDQGAAFTVTLPLRN
ncbi:MAG TPA: ATP-binding protein [Polyangia bacterium]|nr:ATP-binding protein [Polyangia bacterium]